MPRHSTCGSGGQQHSAFARRRVPRHSAHRSAPLTPPNAVGFRAPASVALPGFARPRTEPYNSAVRDWALTSGDPLSLCIAADARLCQPNYADDQIWELRLGGGEPAALAVETSYGLRARGMRIFPAFQLGELYRLDPATFFRPPEVRRFLPNYLRVDFAPFQGVQARSEYWVPESHLLGGRFTLHNQGPEGAEVQVLLHALLHPDKPPGGMSIALREGAQVLLGRTGELAPLVFMAGGASAATAAYPALRVSLYLPAGGFESVQWAQAATRDPVRSHQQARELAGCAWDAEIARLERANASLVDLETGNPDWDAALAFSQCAALAAYVGPTRYLAHPSFVQARSPDHGYSARGDGRDHDLYWDGQSAGPAYLNLQQLLPAAPELAQGVLLNFLETQGAEGAIDWKPGLGGQRSGALCAPLLAGLCWRVYQWTEDAVFLARIFPGLLRFFQAWFTPDHDRDQDGHPEWQHTVQAGYDDWPSFVRWRAWGQGVDVRTAETPDLAAYLYREAAALLAMCEVLGERPALSRLQLQADRLRAALDRSWSESQAFYQHLDRDLHHSVRGMRLGSGSGRFALEIDREFDPPARLVARCRGKEGTAPALRLLIHGVGASGRRRVGRMDQGQFSWFMGLGTATSDTAFRRIDWIEVQGAAEGITTTLRTADYTRQDLTGLLPLWAAHPWPAQAERLVRESLLDPKRFWRPNGIPNCSAADPAFGRSEAEGATSVSVLWNLMLGEGLLGYGYLAEAAELAARLLNACAGALRRDQGFRETYHPDQEQAFGSRHHQAGLAPLSLFLQVLGVRLISPRKVVLRGHNPFPQPVRLRWQGLEIHWDRYGAEVTFPNGERITVEGKTPQVVEQTRVPA